MSKDKSYTDPLKGLRDALNDEPADGDFTHLPPMFVPPQVTTPTPSPNVPTIDLTDKTQQIKDFFLGQHQAEKDYLERMLANVPANVPPWAVDAVRKKLEAMENNGPPKVTVEEGKVTRHTVQELLDADDAALDKLAANYAAHARHKLKGK